MNCSSHEHPLFVRYSWFFDTISLTRLRTMSVVSRQASFFATRLLHPTSCTRSGPMLPGQMPTIAFSDSMGAKLASPPVSHGMDQHDG